MERRIPFLLFKLSKRFWRYWRVHNLQFYTQRGWLTKRSLAMRDEVKERLRKAIFARLSHTSNSEIWRSAQMTKYIKICLPVWYTWFKIVTLKVDGPCDTRNNSSCTTRQALLQWSFDKSGRKEWNDFSTYYFVTNTRKWLTLKTIE